MKNNKREGRGGGGLIREGKLINFLPLKRGSLLERGGLLEKGGGGLVEDLRYTLESNNKGTARASYWLSNASANAKH